VVDVAAAFDTLIRAVREALPTTTLIFNNVNDFPAWITTSSPQDVTYTEVWQPHDSLADLAAVATRARTLAPHRPAVLAAYQNVYDHHPAEVADLTTRFTMATAFSHGATQLLAGESGNVLVDPYYVRNHAAEASTLDMLAAWFDLLVAAGDLLLSPGNADITRSVASAFNDEIDVLGPDGIVMSHEARSGVVWRRVVETAHGTVIHLINLTDQSETGWDTPKAPISTVTGLRLRVRRITDDPPTVRVADPDRGPRFTTVPALVDGDHAHAELPPLQVWLMVFLPR
jgi:dextranase